jgi:hypothetical protein
MIDLEEESLRLQDVNEAGISKIAALVRNQLALEARLSDLEAETKAVEKQLKAVAEDLLPAAMTEHGVSKLSMADGSEITVSKFYSASIPKDKMSGAFSWLRENGHDDLIKNQLSVSFGRGQDEIAEDLMTALREDGYDPTSKVWVEPMTLKAFVREQIEKGTPVPDDLFGVFVGEKAKISRRK